MCEVEHSDASKACEFAHQAREAAQPPVDGSTSMNRMHRIGVGRLALILSILFIDVQFPFAPAENHVFRTRCLPREMIGTWIDRMHRIRVGRSALILSILLIDVQLPFVPPENYFFRLPGLLREILLSGCDVRLGVELCPVYSIFRSTPHWRRDRRRLG